MYESNGIQRVPAAFRDGFSINFVHKRKPRVRFRDSKTKSLLAERLITEGYSATVLYRSCFFTVFHMSLPNTMGYLDGSPTGGEGPRSFSKSENFNRHVPTGIPLVTFIRPRKTVSRKFWRCPRLGCPSGFNILWPYASAVLGHRPVRFSFVNHTRRPEFIGETTINCQPILSMVVLSSNSSLQCFLYTRGFCHYVRAFVIRSRKKRSSLLNSANGQQCSAVVELWA